MREIINFTRRIFDCAGRKLARYPAIQLSFDTIIIDDRINNLITTGSTGIIKLSLHFKQRFIDIDIIDIAM